MAEPVRTALVGCGYWGTNLAKALERSHRHQLVRICDGNSRSLERAGRVAPGAILTESLRDCLADERVEAIVIATPVDSHAAVALECLHSGRHVLVEKPMTRTSADAEILCTVAESTGLTLMVGHTFLYNGAVRRVKEIIDAGELGQIRYVFCQRLNLGIVRSDVDALWSLAPHDLSILNYWIGTRALRSRAVGNSFLQPGVADVAFAHLAYDGGAAGHIHVSWLDPVKVRQATVVGSKKMLIYDDLAVDARIRIFDNGIDFGVDEATLHTFGTYANHELIVRTGAVSTPRVDYPEPLLVEVDEFADSIRENRPAMSGGRDGLSVVRDLERLSAAMVLCP